MVFLRNSYYDKLLIIIKLPHRYYHPILKNLLLVFLHPLLLHLVGVFQKRISAGIHLTFCSH